jgi:hypothetical protein
VIIHKRQWETLSKATSLLRNEFNKATVVAMQATFISPSEILFPATYRRRVLALLLLHPERRCMSAK